MSSFRGGWEKKGTFIFLFTLDYKVNCSLFFFAELITFSYLQDAKTH